MHDEDQLLYRVALGMIPGVGSVIARKLACYYGDISEIFREKQQILQKVPLIGPILAGRITDSSILLKAAGEVDYILKNSIRPVFYQDGEYPMRLNQCNDAPVMLYLKGNLDLNPQKIISIVGTRRPGGSGIYHCRSLIRDLALNNSDVVVVSGLAYGIDVCAHQAALDNQLNTVAVLGHGFGHLYPALHRTVARGIEHHGALLTEFISDTKPERNNFIRRNRIIAGLSDATLIVQSGLKGGALITAEMASGYNREVFAIPGRPGDQKSAGCNRLIKNQIASLVEQAADVEYIMGWTKKDTQRTGAQELLFSDMNDDERALVRILSDNQIHSIDQLCSETGMTVGRVSSLLLKLEFTGMVFCLPGNSYRMYGPGGRY